MRSNFRHCSSITLTALACIALTFVFAQSVQAQVLTIDDVNNDLGTVNISTGAVTTIGNMGGDLMTHVTQPSSLTQFSALLYQFGSVPPRIFPCKAVHCFPIMRA